MRQIVKDSFLNHQLATKGFIVVPFLDNTEVTNLLKIFEAIPQEEQTDFYASSHQSDLEFRKKTNDAIVESFKRSVEQIFNDVELLGGSFISKKPNYNQQLQPHQDWNIVDEKRFRSYNIWVPLVDTTKENGAIMVLPESHLWFNNYRHSSIPCAYTSVHQLLFENMQTLELKAGEALIYDHALLHASQPNVSEKTRIACAAGIKPIEAEMLIYWNNEGQIEEYDCDASYFLRENVFQKPSQLHLRKVISENFISVDEKKLTELSGIKVAVDEKRETSQKKSFFQIYTPINILREIKHRLFK